MSDDNVFTGLCWCLLSWVCGLTVLKLTGCWDLGWVWVLAPLWLPLLGLGAGTVICLLAFLCVRGGGSGQ